MGSSFGIISQTGNNIQTEGLIFYVDPAYKKSYPGTGTNAFNLASGSLTPTGSLKSGTGFVGLPTSSFTFDGTDDYIDYENSNNINIAGDLTLLAWIFVDAHKNYNGIISKINSSTRNYEILVRSNGTISFYTSNSEFTTSTQTITTNTWTHISVSVESGVTNGVKFYFNGVLDSTTGTQTVVANTASLNIGRRTTGDFTFDGKISNNQIYNRALSASDVLQNYQAQKGRFGL